MTISVTAFPRQVLAALSVLMSVFSNFVSSVVAAVITLPVIAQVEYWSYTGQNFVSSVIAAVITLPIIAQSLER